MNTFNQNRVLSTLLLTLGAIVVCLGINAWNETYDPGRGVTPISAVPVTDTDLVQASLCARDVIGAEIRQGLEPTRSKLFYAEWRCEIAARGDRKARS